MESPTNTQEGNPKTKMVKKPELKEKGKKKENKFMLVIIDIPDREDTATITYKNKHLDGVIGPHRKSLYNRRTYEITSERSIIQTQRKYRQHFFVRVSPIDNMIQNLITRFERTGSVGNLPGRCPKRIVRTDTAVEAVQ
ncbi:Hypothetical predicted protein [Octopus vulgaris]|uniref:DUF4817 domain-containing protein n=1 Tax=Octopus vulgaris TaxID=6645 RepID=A0AA36EXJ8_OCTVU|nr:Hypothetical predicted protein [Octopus vulgaris]